MAKVLILGGGFGGVVAAEALARQLGDVHHITLVSRDSRFVFYPSLARLAFGKCKPDDISFDLRKLLLKRGVNFIEAEVARLDLNQSKVIIAHGEVEGDIPYDYLIFALGRRLATERVKGFFEYSHHLLNIEGAVKFGQALRTFTSGNVVIGQCPGARLPLPVYETAFAFSKSAERSDTRITVVGPGTIESEFGDSTISTNLSGALNRNRIGHVPNFPIAKLSSDRIFTTDGRYLNYTLLMLVPPFCGAAAASNLGITGDDGYINVDATMKVIGAKRMYAVGDCVNFSGPKLAHMAVRQAEVAAANVASEIAGQTPVAQYDHEAMMVIDAAGDGIYFHKDLWLDEPGTVHDGRLWNWAKRVHDKYWEVSHL
jgi:sulfide:quinone oxidoreductase